MMHEILPQLKTLAQQRKKIHKKFIQDHKRRPDKDLDEKMLDLHEETFAKTDCLKCANCCKTTGPLFTQKDIERLAKRMKLRPAQFVDKYLRIDEDNDYVLQSVPCPFLGSDNYCSVYEDRPKACREYPHTDRAKQYQILDITYQNISICPAVYHIVERMVELSNTSNRK